jgi:hypothetical protein
MCGAGDTGEDRRSNGVSPTWPRRRPGKLLAEGCGVSTRGRHLAAASAVVAGLAVAAGCVATYKPGSFRAGGEAFEGARSTIGCLDVAVAYVPSAVAVGPVAHFRIGNRCEQPTLVDLAAVRVTARFSDGSVRPMRPYDPEGVIVPMWLDARRLASEHLEYLPLGGAAPTAVATTDDEAWPEAWAQRSAAVEMCLDVAGVDARAGAAATVLCVTTPEETILVESDGGVP